MTKHSTEVDIECLVAKIDLNEVALSVAHRRRNAKVKIQIRAVDLAAIKAVARRYKINYQVLIAEFLHRVAHS